MLSSTVVLNDSPKPNSSNHRDTRTSSAWTTVVKHPPMLEPPKAMDSVTQEKNVHDPFDRSSVSLVMKTAVSTSSRQAKPIKITHTHFASPLRTLSESIMDPGQSYITTHDLTEAYNVLSSRLRTVMQATPTDAIMSCLTIFQEQSGDIEQCLSRDIQRLLPSPFDSQHYSHSFTNHSYYSQDAMDDEDHQRVADNIILCRQALRLVTDIFTFPVVYVQFTDGQLRSLFRDVLLVCNTTSRPIPNSHKACGLVMWLLKSQQLPAPILYSVKIHIISALKNAISHDIGGLTGKHDAFKAVHHILTKNPTFFDSFIELLPSVLDYLNAKSLETKAFAALALGGFVVAKIKLVVSSKPYLGPQAYEIVDTYINAQTSRKKSLDASNCLPAMFEAALSEDPSWKGYGPSFAIVVASSLLCLMDHFFFSSSRALKLVFAVLARSAKHRRSNVRALHPELWRILLWTFSRLPIKADEDSSQDDEALKDRRDRAFRVVGQDLRHGIGLALTSILLPAIKDEEGSGRTSDDVEKVLVVVSDLITKDDATMKEEGIRALDRLLALVGGSSSFDVKTDRRLEIPFSWTLIDGSLLFQGGKKVSVPPTCTPIEEISPLSEEEVANNWDALSDAWILATQNHLSSGQELSPELLRIWQALLLVRSDLTQEHHRHLTAPAAFATHITSTINNFTVPLDTPEIQARYITFIGKLWTVVTNVFTAEWLSTPAEGILAALLKTEFTLVDDQVRDVWSRVCADLIAVSTPTLLAVVHRKSASQEGLEVTRQLWNILARRTMMDPGKEDWMNIVHFLAMPMGVWDLTDAELEIWEGIFREAIDVNASVPESNAMSQFMGLIDESKIAKLKESPRIVWSLLSLSLRASSPLLDRRLLTVVDFLLLSYYPTNKEETEAKIPLASDPLRLIGELVARLRESEIVEFLSTMEASLSCWIIDNLGVLEEDHHNQVVATLYKKPLDLLALLKPSLHILHKTTEFLQSVFVRVRGDGPFVFHSFWRSTYHLCKDIPKHEYPDVIKACLKAWSDICDDSIGDGFSLNSESDSSIIPDSQPDYQDEDPVLDIEQGWMNEHTVGVDSKDISNFLGDSYTPVQRQRTLPFLDVEQPKDHALHALQEYNSHRSIDSVNIDVKNRPPDRRAMSQEASLQASTSKRSLEVEVEAKEPREFKRRRMEVPRIDFRPRAGKERARDFIPSNRSLKVSISEPVSQTPLFRNLSPQSCSQPSTSRKTPVRDEFSLLSTGASGRPRISADEREDVYGSVIANPISPMRSSYDYDTWEKAFSAKDLREVRAEGGDDPDLEEGGDTEAVSGEDDSGDGNPLSPSLSEYPLRSRRRYRSQTAPEPVIESHLDPNGSTQRLRRHQTSPIPNKMPMSAQLDALQRAYSTIAEAGVSQIDVQEIMQARRLANQINQVLDEQMCLKLTSSKHGFDD